MRMIIIGCNGQLGADFMAQAVAAGHDVCGMDYPQIDITDPGSAQRAIESVRPEMIVNCAGYTAVDACETDEQRAFAVNAAGVGNIAQTAQACGAAVAHISTDYVFDGTKSGPYVESDPPNPQSAYGRTKLAGEEACMRICQRHFIFRIAWLYGINGANFVKTIRRAAAEKAAGGGELKVVSDQRGTPTWTVEVCRQMLRVIGTRHFGLFHCTAEGECTWYDFARHIVERAGISAPVVPCTTREFPRPAPRPANSVLENARLKALGLHSMKEWRAAFGEFLATERNASSQGTSL
jgi:dTDP-4-dehydrorhamnose reductase